MLPSVEPRDLPTRIPRQLLKMISDDLYRSADAGDLPKCQTLLAMGADVNHVGEDTMTPLHRASGMGRTPIVKLLIEKGALVNVKNQNGSTPLHLAAQEGHLATARLLVNSGARTDVTTMQGAMPIHCAAQNNRHHILTYLVTEARVSVNVVSTAHSSCPQIGGNGFSLVMMSLTSHW